MRTLLRKSSRTASTLGRLVKTAARIYSSLFTAPFEAGGEPRKRLRLQVPGGCGAFWVCPFSLVR